MPAITLHLRKDKKNAKGTCPVAIIYRQDNEQIILSTGCSVREEDFNPTDKNGQWVKPGADSSESFNALLHNLQVKAMSIQNNFYVQHQRYPTKNEMRDLFNITTGKTEAPDKSVFAMFDNFIHFQSAERGINNVTWGVVLNYRKTKKRLQDYEAYTRKPLLFSSFDNFFYDRFVDYLTKQFGSGVNTIGSYIKIIKTFLKYCQLHHKVNIEISAMAAMKVRQEENWFTWLQMSQIDKLIALDFRHAPLLGRVRDAFVLQCCIGCRHSDLAIMVGENIVLENDKLFLRMKTRKNQRNINVPLTDRVLTILNKYRFENQFTTNWIPMLQICNRYIKHICKEAEFNEPVRVTKGIGTKRKDKTFQQYQLITTHTARRTFINIMVRAQIPDADIAAITGQSPRTLQRYKHADTANIESAMQKVWA